MTNNNEWWLEKAAEIEHRIWAKWQRWVHDCCIPTEHGLTIPKFKVERWNRQINTPYSELSEIEKEYDRFHAIEYREIIAEAEKRERERIKDEIIEKLKFDLFPPQVKEENPELWKGFNLAVNKLQLIIKRLE